MSKRVVELTAEELDKLASDAWGTAAREALAQGHSVTGSSGDMRVRYHPDGTVTELGAIAPLANDSSNVVVEVKVPTKHDEYSTNEARSEATSERALRGGSRV